MISVGIRELRQRASELLRRVAAGETVEVTDRGHPVAMLAPLPAGGGLERLRLLGETTPPEADLDDIPEPLALTADQEAPSAILARLRRDER